MDITLQTINTWKGDGDYYPRMELLAKGLETSGANIILCQECFRTADGTVDTLRFLSETLQLSAWFTASRRKQRRWQGIDTDSYSGLGILTNLPVIDHMSIELPSNASDGGRKAQLVTLEPMPGITMLIANIHLTHLQHDQALRIHQLQTVLHEVARSAAPYRIVGGDFNAKQDSTEILLFKEQTSATALIHHWVDHLFALPPYPSFAHAEIVLNKPDPSGRYPSDHFGLRAGLVLD